MTALTRMLVALSFVLAACGGGINPLAPVPSEVRAASERALVGGVSVQLETYLYRDFAPTSPVDGKPLIAGLRLKSADASPLPSTVHADSVWIINRAAVWAAPVAEEQPRSDPFYVDLVAREGPKWGPGIEVDVVLLLRDESGNRVYIRAKTQPIHRTD